MKKYVKLSIFAEGFYSGATYEESLFLTEDIWNIIKTDIEKKEFFIYELDGKHSRCQCDFEVKEFTEKEIMEGKLVNCDDGDDLYFTVKEVMKNNGIKEVEEVIDAIDGEVSNLAKLYPFEDVTVTIRKKNKEKLMDFVRQLQ
ncbi:MULTISPECIES: hypothetical protein [unclassified Clostridioides]|uniref:hypothetical protein n=1 Tax=unclassified Clostridioides TaxID=2635829 RepID=UPI001D123C80|nr:hypothetical protein [Clostridioides sp. ES-W-0018-02]MCC0713012.1 hypothetical protein [Clostridioides sp. ES-W-0017-02]